MEMNYSQVLTTGTCSSVTKSIFICMALFLTACSSPKYNYLPVATSFSAPPLETISMAGLGENLLDQGVSTQRDILVVEKESYISTYTIQTGKFPKIGEDEKSVYYGQEPNTGYLIQTGLLFKTPSPFSTIEFIKKNSKYCINVPADVSVCGSLNAHVDSEEVVSPKSLRRTLIYSGRVGNRLMISYREFSGNVARPAFNQDVEYDLDESNIIGYSGARLEIIEATNTKITYRVLKNFNTNN